ncbi:MULTISPECIES: hypothetical protein [unclassified Spirillospora]|uniref:hypothetical protein n=1 Tax=unclassified Spirillospora TaxID=2642701 RepID=UPI00371DCC1B
MDALVVWTAALPMFWGVAFGQLWLQRRYCSWLVCVAGKSVAGAVLLTVVVHLGAMSLFAIIAFLINDLVVPNFPTWFAVFLFVLAAMVYSPLVGLAIPARSWPPYETVRPALEEAGATLGQERAVAWIGGLLTFPGMSAVAGGAAILFG